MQVIAYGIDIETLVRAAQSFCEALPQVNSELTRDGAIQRFEYTFELCWKTMRRVLHAKGSEVNHPRDIFREAAAERLISTPASWFGFLEMRNKTSHIYKREIAEEVYSVLPAFKTELEAFLLALTQIKSP